MLTKQVFFQRCSESVEVNLEGPVRLASVGAPGKEHSKDDQPKGDGHQQRLDQQPQPGRAATEARILLLFLAGGRSLGVGPLLGRAPGQGVLVIVLQSVQLALV